MKRPEERKTPGRKPGVRLADTVRLNYRIPRYMAEWIEEKGGRHALIQAVAWAMTHEALEQPAKE